MEDYSTMVMGDLTQETDLLVVGGGPGGYAAAFRAADLGMDVILVEKSSRLGGTCLFRGCIPAKSYLHLSEVIRDARLAENMGIKFGMPEIDPAAIRAWKTKVVDRLAAGLMHLAQQRGIQVMTGYAVFDGPQSVRLQNGEVSQIKFEHAIIATGSHAMRLPGDLPTGGARIMTSDEALALKHIPADLLVVGGGYVGLELGSLYAAFGSRVTLIEARERLLPGADMDLVRVLENRILGQFANVYLNTRISGMEVIDSRIQVDLTGSDNGKREIFDHVLAAIGRKPNTSELGLANAGVDTDENGFVRIDDRQRTANPRIFAVGDAAGGVMLAHKAAREGKVAAEVIAGQPAAFDPHAIPVVVYTNPQVAWAGITEDQAATRKIAVDVRRFPWKAAGRAATMGLGEGLTKMIVEPETQRIIGMGIVGRNAEALIAEGVLAIEMGALVEDLALSIHPHPTLSETEAEVAELFLGSTTHIFSPEKK